MKTNFTVREYSETLLPIDLTEEDRIYLQNAAAIEGKPAWVKRFYVDELKNAVRLQTVSFVGTIELSSWRITIQPKFNEDFQDVMRMIAFSEELPFNIERSTSASHTKSDLFILLANLFLKLAESLIHKLKKDYKLYEEDLKTVRGQIQMLKTATTHYLIPKGVICEFDELTTNILENQIILSVLQLIRKHPSFHQNALLAKLLQQYESVCDSYSGASFPKFQYNRLNHQYETAHKIGELLFNGLFVDNYYQNSNSYMTILVDMNELFERFVAQLLRKYLPSAYAVSHSKRIRGAITAGDQSYRDIIPDIVVRSKQRAIVIDTKYKLYDNKKIETADIFQLTFYAQHFCDELPSTTKIIYPVFNQYSEKQWQVETNKHTFPGVIHVQSLNIEKVLQLYANKKIAQLKEVAISCVE